MMRASLRTPDEAKRLRGLRLLGATFLLLVATGCVGRAGRYGQARIFDFFDAVPVSLASGYGLSVNARATPYLGVGAGYADVIRFGFGDGRFGPYWQEEIKAVPLITSIRHQAYPQDGDRWPGGDPVVRAKSDLYVANSYLFAPGLASDGGLWPPPLGGDPEWQWPYRSNWELLNVELGVMVLFGGIRVGVSPFQTIDFLAGIFTLDPADDDPDWIFSSSPDSDSEATDDAEEPET